MSYNFTDAQSNSFEPLPVGKYPVAITKAEIKASKSGGSYFNFKLTVLDGEFKSRTLFHMCTLENSNEKAVQIGRGQMKDMLIALGFETPSFDSIMDLEGHKAIATVAIKTDEYGAKNVIKKFEKYTTSESTPF